MSVEADRFVFLVTGSQVDHIDPESLCHSLPVFPPPDDFPMMVDLQGEPVCRYGDHKWLIGDRPINFGTDPGKLGNGSSSLTQANGELLKRCIAWFMYGERRNVTVNTLICYHQRLKCIFAFCSNLARPVDASELSCFFENLEMPLAQVIPPCAAKITMSLLYELWLAREHLGFILLDPKQITSLRQLIPIHKIRQTLFIPPRIWGYQSGRLQAFLEDFLAHKIQFEAALRELLDAYRANYGSLAESVSGHARQNRHPCAAERDHVRGCSYVGSFSSFADRHGIRDVIVRWLFPPGTVWGSLKHEKKSVCLLNHYLNAIGLVGQAYLQCFSGMRRGEALTLRCNCLSVEHDPMLGDVYILSGETTKTIKDDSARWLAAPTVASAVEAMSVAARWRTDVAVEIGEMSLTAEDKANPYLIQRGFEPWAPGGAAEHRNHPAELRPHGYEVNKWACRVSGLFEGDFLRITKEDATYVRRFNDNVDMEKYGEGCDWHLTSHQYRRTAAVMMAASQVSPESQQYQFKHLTRNQSAYYRRGFQSLRLNRAFSHELVEARYELVSLELGLLNGPEYVSPISPARKDEILNFHEVSSGDEIQKAIKKGYLAVKQTLFGVCTRRDSCPYGGHDNIAHCPTCNDALLSKRKRNGVEQLGKTIALRVVDAPQGTPLRAQLDRSTTAIERFMDVTA
jgi:hypothetical protein